MKCVQNVLTNKIERVTDAEADRRAAPWIKQEVWRFVPKHKWKAQERK